MPTVAFAMMATFFLAGYVQLAIETKWILTFGRTTAPDKSHICRIIAARPLAMRRPLPAFQSDGDWLSRTIGCGIDVGVGVHR